MEKDMSVFVWECCGGELFLHLPGLGAFHIPMSFEIATRFSILLPIVCILHMVTFALLRVIVACLNRRRSNFTSMFLNASVVVLGVSLMPCILHSRLTPYMGELVGTPLEEEEFNVVSQNFAESVLDNSDGSLHLISNATFMTETDAFAFAQKVYGLKSKMNYHLGSRGTPHLTLGVKYPGQLQGGKFRGLMGPDQESRMIWQTFHALYEQLRVGISEQLQAPVRIHRRLFPPSFLMWLSNVINTFQTDLHQDPLLVEEIKGLDQYLMDLLKTKHSTSDVICHYNNQYTLIAPLLAPRNGEWKLHSGQDGSFALKLWHYDKLGCTGQINESNEHKHAARPECVTRQTIPYNPGQFVMFPSRTFHASCPWSHSQFDLDPRIIMVGFVIPCEIGGELEYQMFGSVGGKPEW